MYILAYCALSAWGAGARSVKFNGDSLSGQTFKQSVFWLRIKKDWKHIKMQVNWFYFFF